MELLTKYITRLHSAALASLELLCARYLTCHKTPLGSIACILSQRRSPSALHERNLLLPTRLNQSSWNALFTALWIWVRLWVPLGKACNENKPWKSHADISTRFLLRASGGRRKTAHAMEGHESCEKAAEKLILHKKETIDTLFRLSELRLTVFFPLCLHLTSHTMRFSANNKLWVVSWFYVDGLIKE